MFSAGSRSQIGSSRPVMMWNALSENSGTRGAFGFPQRREFFGRGLAPVRAGELVERDGLARSSAAQGGCALRPAPSSSIRLAAGTCTAARCDCSLTGAGRRSKRAQFERLGERQGAVAVLAQDAVAAGFGAGRGMGVTVRRSATRKLSAVSVSTPMS